MVAGLILLWITIGAPTGCYICLHPNNWLDTSCFGGLVEFNCPTHGAVVSNSARCHTHIFDSRDKVWNLRQTIKQTVVSMVMQMYVIRRRQHLLARFDLP